MLRTLNLLRKFSGLLYATTSLSSPQGLPQQLFIWAEGSFPGGWVEDVFYPKLLDDAGLGVVRMVLEVEVELVFSF